MRKIFFALLLLPLVLWVSLVPLVAWAQAPKVMVRAAVLSKGPAVAGQQVRLRVDALTTTWFLQAPVYPQVSAPNAVINLLDEQADHINETINGEKWFGLSRSYLVTPTGSGDIVIPPIEITMVPGQGNGAVKARTPAVKIAVKAVPRPAGTENMLASTHVEISQRLDRKLDDLKVGDAFTRTIEVNATGAQGMFIPPTTFPALKGLTVYPKAGKVDNIIKDRVGFLGSHRIDAATYVIQQEGDYELPAINVEWWNTSTGKIEKAEAPALKFSAVPNPGYKPEFALPTEAGTQASSSARLHFNWHQIATVAGLMIAAIAALSWLARRLPGWWQSLRAQQTARRQRYEASEPGVFRHFAQATKRGNAAAIYAALLAWIEHPDNVGRKCGANALSSGTNSTVFVEQFDSLRAVLYGDSELGAWQPDTLYRLVAVARKQTQTRLHAAHRNALGPLNP